MERKIEFDDYRGPVRMDDGDILEDPVSARIDILSKEFNPTGFEKLKREEKIETNFGGINLYFSFDLSGSMREADSVSGRRKADVQRDTALLFADSLMQCAYVSRQQSENSDLLPIKIMVTLASERGEVNLNLTDKWRPKEQWAFYSALNQLAMGGTPTHETLKLIEKDFDAEIADLKKKRISKEKLPLHYTVEISDGAPDDFDETEAMHKKLKEKGMTIRSYCIGGISESEDAAEPIVSFSQLPEILSKDIIEKFKKLNPKRIQL
ncbi:MAG: vWA domain-containing protein [bacterium]|nr:vWA domain-containing protein [bacterium]